MNENDLKEYIEKAKAYGMNVQQVRDALVGAGWDAAMVDSMFGLSSPAVPAAPSAPVPVPPPAATVPAQQVVASTASVPTPSASTTVSATAPSGETTVRFAGFWRKFFASMFDGAYASLPFIAFIIAFTLTENNAFIFLCVPAGVWMLIYRPLLEGRYGATWAMHSAGLRIIREDEPQRVGIGFWLSVGRAIVSVLSGTLTANISFFWMLMDPRRREVADLICKTVVLHDPKKAFSFGTIESIPPRGKQVIWFAIVALMGALSIFGAMSSGSR